VSWHQKCKTALDSTEARDREWPWHQLGHMQVCTLLQTDNHASNPPLSFLQAGCPFLHNQQHQSTEGSSTEGISIQYKLMTTESEKMKTRHYQRLVRVFPDADHADGVLGENLRRVERQ